MGRFAKGLYKIIMLKEFHLMTPFLRARCFVDFHASFRATLYNHPSKQGQSIPSVGEDGAVNWIKCQHSDWNWDLSGS